MNQRNTGGGLTPLPRAANRCREPASVPNGPDPACLSNVPVKRRGL